MAQNTPQDRRELGGRCQYCRQSAPCRCCQFCRWPAVAISYDGPAALNHPKVVCERHRRERDRHTRMWIAACRRNGLTKYEDLFRQLYPDLNPVVQSAQKSKRVSVNNLTQYT